MGWAEFKFSYMNLDKINEIMLRRNLISFPRGLYHTTDEYIIRILQKSQPKQGVPTIKQPKP